MSIPSSSMTPARAADGTSSCMRLRVRRKVDLPQPDGPISAVTLNGSMSSETSARTWWLANQAWTRRVRRLEGAAGASPAGTCGADSRGKVTLIAILCDGDGCGGGDRCGQDLARRWHGR